VSYDALNQPLSFTFGSVPAQTAPTASSSAFSYVYNSMNQTINQTATDNSWWSYPTTASSLRYSTNGFNQYTAVGAVTPTYDGNGNLTFDGTFTYGYDAESRLTSVAQSGTPIATYAYDAQGRRKSKTVGATTTNYLLDPSNRALFDYDGSSGQIARWYSFGSGLNEVLNQVNVSANTRTTFIPDTQGSIIGTLDSGSGAITKTGYQVFGESPSTAGTFRYTGARIDAETNGLYDFRARMYSAALGRFLQPDPIGFSGGTNLYAYVNNDPLNLTDPTGAETQIGIARSATIAWIIGVNGSVTVGVSMPDNPTNIGGYQLFATPQLTGYVGVGGFADYGVGLSVSTSNGPLPLLSANPTWQAEADVGYGPSVGASIGGSRSACDGHGCRTWDAPSGIGLAPNPKIGQGYGAYAGVGPGGSFTLATPTVGQIADWVSNAYKYVGSWFSPSSSGAPATDSANANAPPPK
jgi:RHS repeat-associated protein